MAGSSQVTHAIIQPDGEPALPIENAALLADTVTLSHQCDATESPANEQNVTFSPNASELIEASLFTWLDAVMISFAIFAFFSHTFYGAMLLLHCWLTGQVSRFLLTLALLLLTAIAFRAAPEVRDPRTRKLRPPVTSHPIPIEFTKLKARSGSIYLAPPVWFSQELFYGVKSKLAIKKEDKEFYLSLIQDIKPFNHVLSMYQGSEALIYLAVFLFHLGPRLLEPSSMSFLEWGSLVISMISHALAEESTRFEINHCVPHKFGQCDNARGRPPLFKFVQFLSDLFNFASRVWLVTVFCLSFGPAMSVRLLVVWPLIGNMLAWFQRADSFHRAEPIATIVTYQVNKRNGIWSRVFTYCVHSFRHFLLFLQKCHHCNMHPGNLDALIDIGFNFGAMFYVWRHFENKEPHQHLVAITLTPVLMNVLSKALKKLTVIFERKN